MLPRKNLISLKEQFSKLKRAGKTYNSPSFGLLVSYSNLPTDERVAFIVSKKVSLKSTERHEVKRKLADAIKPYLVRIPQNVQLVFLAKQKAVVADKNELAQEIEVVFNRSRLV